MADAGQNIKAAVSNVNLITSTSKAGNKYSMLSLMFTNGYEHRIFLDSAAVFAVEDAARSLQQNDLGNIYSPSPNNEG